MKSAKKISFNYELNGKILHYSCNDLRDLKISLSKENALAPRQFTKIIYPKYKGMIFVQEPRTVDELIYAIEHDFKRERSLRNYSKNDYERIGVYSFDEVFPYLVDVNVDAKDKNAFLRYFSGEPVSMNNAKYHVFKKSCECVCCGLKGSYLALERCRGKDDESLFHFNMYGLVNGEEVLFTKDHILPKSKGGTNTLDNYQTMCTQCNAEKGNSNVPLEILKKRVLHKRQRAYEVGQATRPAS